MSRCETFQEEIGLELAIGDSGAEALGASCQEHLAECADCQEFLEQELELNRALAEPTPLPPPDLADKVMARVTLEREAQAAPALPWGERMAWAASGAAVMFCINNLPAASANWISKLQMAMSNISFSWQVPYALSSTSVMALAALMISVQGMMVYQVRVSRQ